MRRWVCVARLPLKPPSAVCLGGCSGSAASMAAPAQALRPGRDACSGTDGPSSFLVTRDGRRSVQGGGIHLGGRLGSREAAVATAGARGLNLGLGGGVWRRWLVNARWAGSWRFADGLGVAQGTRRGHLCKNSGSKGARGGGRGPDVVRVLTAVRTHGSTAVLKDPRLGLHG